MFYEIASKSFTLREKKSVMKITERNYSRILGRKDITEIGTMKKFKNRKTSTSQRKWNEHWKTKKWICQTQF
jgi:hypothetical protein